MTLPGLGDKTFETSHGAALSAIAASPDSTYGAYKDREANRPSLSRPRGQPAVALQFDMEPPTQDSPTESRKIEEALFASIPPRLTSPAASA
ncbi:hypothetical protein ACG7TL_007836 [Trametes sanguinea]